MSLDEPQSSDIELRDLITERLSKYGVINEIKAQLRAGVLLSLSQEKDCRIPIYDQKKKIQNVVKHFEGKLAISLIKDFMQQLNLKHTLSVFELETGIEELNLETRESIIQDFKGVINDEDTKSPLIFGFLKNLNNSNNNMMPDKDMRMSSGTSKNKRSLPLVNDKKEKDRISYKSDESSDFSDAIFMPDSSGHKNLHSGNVPNAYQTVSKPSRAINNNEISYEDSFSDKSSTTKNNDDKSDEDSIKEIDIEEIDERSESRTGDVTIDSERSLSLDYAELARKKF